MYGNLIHIFINEKNIIRISKYSSLYSLKNEIHKKIYSNISFEEFNNKFRLSLNGKMLENNSMSLISFNIDNDSNINVEKRLEGGNWSSLFWLYTIYGICFIIYIVFLLSGILPIIANLFGSIFRTVVHNLINYFTRGKNNKTIKTMKSVLEFILYIFSFCFTLFFVWALTSYAVFPFYYFKTNDFCKSGLAAEHVGKVTMFWYMFIYGLYNFIDIVLVQSEKIISKFPHAISSIATPFLTGSKKSWDSFKFLPLYFIPFMGNAISGIHKFIGIIVPHVNDTLTTIKLKNISCDNDEYMDEACTVTSLVSNLLIKVEKQLKKIKNIEEGNPINNNQSANNSNNQSEDNSKNCQGYKKILDCYDKRLDKRKENDLESKYLKIIGDATLMPVILFIRKYKLENVFNLLKYGLCNIHHKNKLKKKNYKSYMKVTLKLPAEIINKFNKQLTDEDIEEILKYSTKKEMGKKGINVDDNIYWFSGFVTSAVCQVFEFINDMSEVLLGIGNADEVENMWKTGTIAGFITFIPFIIDMLWNIP